MRYKGTVGALVVLSLLLPMSAVAETIFWLDTPADGATVFGLVEVNGFVVAVRHAPREIQEMAFEEGLIPYIPADQAEENEEE